MNWPFLRKHFFSVNIIESENLGANESCTTVIVLSVVIVTQFSQTSCLGLSFETINNELWHLEGVKTILTLGRVSIPM